MKEYDAVGAPAYDSYAQGVEGDVGFYVDWARRVDGDVLELGCGTGRVLVPTAEAGARIVGLDCAPAMLDVARKRLSQCPDAVGKRVELVEGDMRGFSLGRKFDLITIPFRSFLHLLTTEEQQAALRCVRDHLADDGKFVFNVFDPNLELIVGSAGGKVARQTEFNDPANGHRVIMSVSRRYDLAEQTIDEYFIFEELDDDGRMVSKRYSHMTLRYVFRYEMQHLLELSGFSIEALHGGFRGEPFTHGGEQVWITRQA